MTAHRLIFHPGVEADIRDIVAFYAERDPALPSAFRARLKEQVDRVGLFPRAGAVPFEDYRRVLLKQFPFMVAGEVAERAEE
jgi:plasmid stabilization system protein ParE